MHDYLSEDIHYYKALPTNYKKLNYVKFDDTTALLDNSSRISYIRNDMHLFRDRTLRREIYSYLHNKDNLLKDINYFQEQIHIKQNENVYNNELDTMLAKKMLGLQEISKKAEELNKILEKYIKIKK